MYRCIHNLVLERQLTVYLKGIHSTCVNRLRICMHVYVTASLRNGSKVHVRPYSGKLESQDKSEISSMSSIINITPEQAAALLPLLQSIASQSQTRANRTAGNGSQDSSSNSSFVHDSSSEEHCEGHLGNQSEEAYELKELLTKKARNTKSTKAQNFLHVSIVHSTDACMDPYMPVVPRVASYNYHQCICVHGYSDALMLACYRN